MSNNGGVQPVWRQDGRELYYLRLDGVLEGGGGPDRWPPPILNAQPLVRYWPCDTLAIIEQYAVGADGQRFLILKPAADKVRNSVGVILNWPSLVQGRRSR